jgi:small-conductance mechanosensitive channel
MRYVLLFLVLSSLLYAEKPQPAQITVAGQYIVTLYSRVGSFTPVDRALAIQKRIENLAHDRFFSTDAIKISETPSGIDILTEDQIILTLTKEDAKAADKSLNETARFTLKNIKSAIETERTLKTPRTLLMRIGYSLTAILILAILLFLSVFVFKKIQVAIKGPLQKYIGPFKLGSIELLSHETVSDFLLTLTKAFSVLSIFSIFYFYVPIALSFFPLTANLAPKLLAQLMEPIKTISNSIILFFPDLVSILFITIITKFFLRVIRLFFIRVGRGNITLNNFYPEWADPTYKLIRMMVIALALVAAFPYIPGSKSPAFQAVSVFLGVLLSLGSSSAISNIVAGVVLTYMRPFKMGDRVKIADTMGDVIEKSLLITRIRTTKNVNITIPNSMVLASHIINYSSSAQDLGLILNTQVTIGYDTPWKKVHELLINAAKKTESILKNPAPFVLQISLNDFTITYEINAYTQDSNSMANLYSRLHENIQNEFNEAGVEILSPDYTVYRKDQKITPNTSPASLS